MFFENIGFASWTNSESVFNALYIEISTNVKRFPLGKINGTKTASFFIRELQLITVLPLNCSSYMSSLCVCLCVCVCGGGGGWGGGDFPFSIPFRIY